MNYILLIIGFFLLIKGADIFVDGASGISKKLGIPSVIVGLTIVSLGTSAPELAVSIVSSLQGSNEIAVGNVLGSNIFNTLMVFGVTLIIMPLIIKKSTIKKDFLINIAVTTLFLLLTFNGILLGKENYISRFDGFILLSGCILYILFLIWTVRGQKGGKSKDVAAEMAIEDEGIEHINIPKSIISLIIGAICIVIGGNIVVDSASSIATALGMSDKLVGLTIVAMGTSLPELVTSAMAALKGEEDMALGNILGSNIFNILLIIGASSIITPMIVSSTLIVDFIFLILVTILIGILIFAHKGKEKRLGKLEGILFVSLYIGYMVYIIFRN
ncbi:calcium/sodium antiporter [Clostridium disporicum]|uniref:Calcium/proton exchanger n=1 Tax=Clostridium disporicum TaxID=84024 RepID=A0A174J6H7_9CLOT|nr:calcium/sodium antiporter [Clostridium disporicum]CUO95324.1 calcium/proton exchanger [Clostridium disporicum]